MMDSEQRAATIVAEMLYRWLKGMSIADMEDEPVLVEVDGTDAYDEVLSELRRIKGEMVKRAGLTR